MSRYDSRVTPWSIEESDFPRSGSLAQQVSFLLNYAILAPSLYNTQPWKFVVGSGEIHILADTSRWLPHADPDRRELFLSLGCALEHLLIAAERFGFVADVTYAPEPFDDELAAVVTLRPGAVKPTSYRRDLFAAIRLRHTSHRAFDGCPISPADLRKLTRCCVDDGIALRLCTADEARALIELLVARADAIQFADPALRRELAGRKASPFGQLPPGRLGAPSSRARHDVTIVASAPAIGMLVSRTDDRASRLRTGQAFARIALLCATREVRIQPMSQLLRVAALRSQVVAAVEFGEKRVPVESSDEIPQVVFRLGYASHERGHTPRLAPADVVVHTPQVWFAETPTAHALPGGR